MAAKEISVKKYVVRLNGEEREQLKALIRKGKSAAQRLLKARILLKADVSEAGEGWSDNRIIKPRSDVDTVPEYVIALDQDVSEVDPDPEQHPAVSGHPFVPLGHHSLHGHRAFDRIDHWGKLKEDTVARGFYEATTMLCHVSVSNCAVLTKHAGCAHLVEPHKPWIARYVRRDDCR
jgi:hypothetical protein